MFCMGNTFEKKIKIGQKRRSSNIIKSNTPLAKLCLMMIEYIPHYGHKHQQIYKIISLSLSLFLSLSLAVSLAVCLCLCLSVSPSKITKKTENSKKV